MKKYGLIFCLFLFSFCFTQAQFVVNNESNQGEEYIYVEVTGRGIFSKKLRVYVDMGDEANQIQQAEKLSNELEQRRSSVAVLNYLSKLGYNLINSQFIDRLSISQGTGSSDIIGISFLMKRKKQN